MGLFKRDTPNGAQPGEKVRAALGKVPGCLPISAIKPRSVHKVAGIVGSIRLVPRADIIRLEITITDGTGEVSGVWFGHHKVAGLDLGSRVSFEGMIGSPSPGKLEILHPTYQLLGDPLMASR